MMDILDGFQKLVSTRRTFSISISIGLDCRDPQPYINRDHIKRLTLYPNNFVFFSLQIILSFLIFK